MPLDPVCRKHVDIGRAAASFDYHGMTVYFCSVDCEKGFEKDPDKYMHAMTDDEIEAA